jgi:hypothetical protein
MRFMTLPFPGASQVQLRRGFQELTRRIRRTHGAFDYKHVTERGAVSGVLHLHVLFYGSYIAQGWLSTTWEAITGYAVVDIRAADPGAAVYMAKTLIGYLGKSDGHGAESAGWSGGRRLRTLDDRIQDELAKAKVSRNPSRTRVVARGR